MSLIATTHLGCKPCVHRQALYCEFHMCLLKHVKQCEKWPQETVLDLEGIIKEEKEDMELMKLTSEVFGGYESRK